MVLRTTKAKFAGLVALDVGVSALIVGAAVAVAGPLAGVVVLAGLVAIDVVAFKKLKAKGVRIEVA